jgi:hypothetical protein
MIKEIPYIGVSDWTVLFFCIGFHHHGHYRIAQDNCILYYNGNVFTNWMSGAQKRKTRPKRGLQESVSTVVGYEINLGNASRVIRGEWFQVTENALCALLCLCAGLGNTKLTG